MTNVSAFLNAPDPVAASSIQTRYGVLKHFRNAKKKQQQCSKSVKFCCELQVYETQNGRKTRPAGEVVGSKWNREELIVKLYPNAIKVLPPLPHGSKKHFAVAATEREIEDPL